MLVILLIVIITLLGKVTIITFLLYYHYFADEEVEKQRENLPKGKRKEVVKSGFDLRSPHTYLYAFALDSKSPDT